MSEDANKTIDDLLKDAQDRMAKTIKIFEEELSRVRTGRASVGLVEKLKVDYYGTPMPLNQIATISIPDPKTILIQPWDPNAISVIEKAITQSDLGLTPNNDGTVIRLSVPPLTEERRRELVKHISKIAEEYRVAIRQIRKDANNHIKELEKKQGLPEDETKKALAYTQKLTDDSINKINKLFEKKEKEIMEI